MPETQTPNEAAIAPPSISEKRLAANRRNAQRSTGPRTAEGKARVRMNALRHGGYARSLSGRLNASANDSAEYEELLNDLIAAHRPANASERLLVEDLAGLRWQRRRAERAHAALQAQALESLTFERRRRALSQRQRCADFPYRAVIEVGLANVEDSRGKFSKLIILLESLRDSVRLRQVLPGSAELARSVYGIAPNERGAQIISDLKKASEPPSCNQPDEGRLAMLELMLNQELRAAKEAFELYKDEHEEISPAAADACLAPKGQEWNTLLRLLNMIDRNIERKTRLLLHVQTLRARRPARPRPAAAKRKRSRNRVFVAPAASVKAAMDAARTRFGVAKNARN